MRENKEKPLNLKLEPSVSEAVINSAIDSIILIDRRGIIKMVNPAVIDLFGYTQEELVGNNISMLMPEPDKSRHDGYIKNYLEGGPPKIIGKRREVLARNKNGKSFPVLLAISEANFGNERYFAGTIHDLSELRAIGNQLKESEMQMLHLSANLPVGAVYRIDEELHLNKKIQDIIGYSDEEIKEVNDWFEALMGPKWIEYREMYEKDRRKGFKEIRTYRIKTKSGRYRWVDFAAYSDNKGEVWILHDITPKVLIEQELIALNEDLERRVQEKTLELKDYVLALEETNQKLTSSEEELKQALDSERDLNELKSRFVSTASHEFRTPLSSILSSVDLISMYTTEGQSSKREKHIQKIRKSVKSLTNILNDFLSLGRIEEGNINPVFAEVDMEEILKSIREELRYLEKDEERIQFYINCEKSSFCTDKKILSTILTNLLNNGLKYSSDVVSCELNQKNGQLHIRVTDKGIGIPEEEQKHLFTRFFRAKNAEHIDGTGLGLSIVQKYVEILGGDLDFKSEEGEGTTFQISLTEGPKT